MQQLKDGDLRLESPSITSGSKTLYMQKPPALEKATRPNLDKAISTLINSGDELTVTDQALENINLTLSVVFE
jgi:ubiquitin-activating enzyme E1 C